MAKRFTDTDKWKKSLLKSMPAKYKLLWLYICDDCNHAGIWDVDLEVAGLRIGEEVDKAEAERILADKIVVFDNGEKWFLPSFIEFQYGELNENNRVHESVFKELSKNNLLKNKGLTSPLQGAKDKDKDKDKEKEKESAVVVDLEPETTYPIEKCLEIALKDERWVKANTTNKAELQQFNAALTGTGEYEKNPMDYKKHFHHWKKKGKLPEVVPKMQTGGGLAKIEAMLRGGGSG